MSTNTLIAEAAENELDAELAAIILEADAAEEEIVAAEVDVEEADAVVSEVEAEEALEASYVELDPGADPDISTTATPEAEAEVKPKSKRASTAGMKPSEVIMSKVPDCHNVLVTDNADIHLSEVDRANKASDFLDKVDAAPKKVGEKIVNVACSLANGDNVSVYTKIAVDLLNSEKAVSLAQLKDHYMNGCSRPYSSGTASAQASQMMKVLPMLGIAHVFNKGVLSWVEDNPIGTFIVAKENKKVEK